MSIEIQPYTCVGNLLFGMPMDSVRKILGSDFDVLGQRFGKPLVRNFYATQGIFVDFCKSGNLVAVELCSPADPVFETQHLLRTPYSNLIAWFTRHDPDVILDMENVDSIKFGITLYCPDWTDQPANPPTSIMAFERDHLTKAYPAL